MRHMFWLFCVLFVSEGVGHVCLSVDVCARVYIGVGEGEGRRILHELNELIPTIQKCLFIRHFPE